MLSLLNRHRVPLRTGLVRRVIDWGEFTRTEEADGTLHAWSPDAHVVVLPDAPAQLFLRTERVCHLRDGVEARTRRMVVARLGGAWLHVLDGHLHFGPARLTLAEADRRKTPIPPRDGNTYTHRPVKTAAGSVRLYMTDRTLILTLQQLA